MVMTVAVYGDHVPNGQFLTFDMVSVVWQTQCSVIAGQDQSAFVLRHRANRLVKAEAKK